MTDEELPWIGRARFASAREQVLEAGELRLQNAQITADQLCELLAVAPRDDSDPSRRHLNGLQLDRVAVVGDLDLDDLDLGCLRFTTTTFDGQLRLRRVRCEGAFDVIATTFGSLRFEDATFATAVCFDAVDFTGVTEMHGRFHGPVRLSRSTFAHRAVFHAADFRDTLDIRETTFASQASFGNLAFRGAVHVADSTFADEAIFREVMFRDDALFTDTSFEVATFDAATFCGRGSFDRSSFDVLASFERARFLADTRFNEVHFGRVTAFEGAMFSDYATFSNATFERARQMGPLLAGTIGFRGAVFAQPIRIELAAHHLLLERALFQQGADLFVRWASVVLDEASFSGPSLLAQLPGPPHLSVLGREFPSDQEGWRCIRGQSPARAEPRIVSLRSAKVAQLTVSGVDLRTCQFADAHGLDGMHLEQCSFASTPKGISLRLRHPRWTSRRTIAEEHVWRFDHGHGEGWHRTDMRHSSWLERPPSVPTAEQVTAVYRALRKGREDAKDEPGAADFYYGEMEMRRQAARLPASGPMQGRTRVVVGLYWLLSGYGLRASRALVALTLALALLAIPLDLWGFRPDRAYGRSLLFAAESSISLFRAPTVKLTASGEVVQLVLRLVGPLLFGLAVLSFRGRVKR